jgi:hypothetical protein
MDKPMEQEFRPVEWALSPGPGSPRFPSLELWLLLSASGVLLSQSHSPFNHGIMGDRSMEENQTQHDKW